MTFPDIPMVPPILAASHDSISYNSFFPTLPCHLPTPSHPVDKGHPIIKHYFSPDHTDWCWFNWIRPDLLSPLTHANNMFLHLSSFQPSDPVDQIDIWLLILNSGTEEPVVKYPFFLPQSETLLGNLLWLYEKIYDIIIKHHHVKGSENVRF